MKGMSLIVKQVTKLVVGFIFLFAAYIVLYGHLTPGGGFAGGVIAACAFVLLVLAFGKEFVNTFMSDSAFSLWDCIGALGFLIVAVAGYLGGAFFYNLIAKPVSFKLWSAGVIPLINVAIGIKVAAGLGGVFVALVAFRLARPAGKEKAEL